MEPKPIQERVSVLETRMDGHDVIVEHNQELLLKFFDRFESHVEMENKRSLEIEMAMNRIGDQLVQTNKTLAKIEVKTNSNDRDIIGAKSAWRTVVTICSITAMFVSGGWVVYEFAVDHPEHITVKK